MPNDAPDYQRVLNTTTTAMSDAPDWEEVAVGPGGGAIGTAGGATVPHWPPDQNYAGETWDLALATNRGSVSVVGGLLLSGVKWVQSRTVNDVVSFWSGTDPSPTPNQNYLAVYTPTLTSGVLTALTLVASTSAGTLDPFLVLAGQQVVPLSGSLSVRAGQWYYVGPLIHKDPAPNFVLAAGNPDNNKTSYVYPPGLYFGSGYSAPPASVDLTSTTWTLYQSGYWMALR